MSGTLFVVATPIGNLDDLTPRARQTLAAVDLIAAEDTRHTRRLLLHFGLKTPLFALHEHNEDEVAGRIVADLDAGKSVALVSDAGTPLISDPGYRVVQAAHRADIPVSPIPGASAVAAALSVAGLPTDRFCFEGFLPARRSARCANLAGLAGETRTMVFFESVHRIADCLDDMISVFGTERPAFLGRELTKLHEQTTRASLGVLGEMTRKGQITPKGECVVVVAGTSAGTSAPSDVDYLLTELANTLPGKEVVRILARATGEKRNTLYDRMLELKKRSE